MPSPTSPSYNYNAFLADVLHQFISSPPFLIPVTTFIDENCSMFEHPSSDTDANTDEEFTPGHHALFLNFRSLIETLLADVLQSLGYTITDFVQVLEIEIQGSVNQRVISVMDSLRGMDDFITFHDNMVARNVHLQMVEEGRADAAKIENRKSLSASSSSPSFSSAPASSTFEIQVAEANSLLSSLESITPDDQLLIPWAHATLKVQEEILTGCSKRETFQEFTRKITNLKKKANVDKLIILFELVEKSTMQRRKKLVHGLKNTSSNTKRVEILFKIMEELRHDVSIERGRCVSWCNVDGVKIGSTELEMLYFKFKDLINDGSIPSESINTILSFTEDVVSLEDGGGGFFVGVLNWLEVEGLIADVNRRIHEVLNDDEREDDKDDGFVYSDDDDDYDDEVEEYADEGGVLCDDTTDHKIHWIEQYDFTTGFNYYFNNVTSETQWEPPLEAYVPISLDALGYEMVEKDENEEATESEGYENAEEVTQADWEWGDVENKWRKVAGADDKEQIKESIKKEEEKVGAVATTPSKRDKKSSKKKKKFLIRLKESEESVLGPDGKPLPTSAITFNLASTSKGFKLSKKEKKKMEDMLIGGDDDGDGDGTNSDSQSKGLSSATSSSNSLHDRSAGEMKKLRGDKKSRVTKKKEALSDPFILAEVKMNASNAEGEEEEKRDLKGEEIGIDDDDISSVKNLKLTSESANNKSITRIPSFSTQSASVPRTPSFLSIPLGQVLPGKEGAVVSPPLIGLPSLKTLERKVSLPPMRGVAAQGVLLPIVGEEEGKVEN